jgi:hypothetical protein
VVRVAAIWKLTIDALVLALGVSEFKPLQYAQVAHMVAYTVDTALRAIANEVREQ